MATKKKRGYKGLTVREKEYNKQWKKSAVERGILPPSKKPLNRKKFAKETVAEFQEYSWSDIQFYVLRALSYRLPSGDYTVSAEDVGVLKLLKIAMELKKYVETKSSQGIKEYTIGEIIDDVILPIKNL